MDRRVLFTASTFSHIRNFHLPYLEEFQKQGWSTYVGCKGVPESNEFADKLIEVPFCKKMIALNNLRASRQLRELIQKEHVDLVITHTSLASFFTRIALTGMRRHVPLVNVVHGYLFDDDSGIIRRLILLGAEELTSRQTDLLLTMNNYDYSLARKYRLGKEIKNIPGMGVPFEKLEFVNERSGRDIRKELGIKKDSFVLLYAAEFSKRKSQQTLIDMMSMLPENVVLVLCGEGQTLESCKETVRERALSDRVLFPGHVSDIAEWYKMADAVVSSSRIEGMPFNIIEAMHLGLPVIASEVKGHIDLIRNWQNGVLFPYGDSEACADRIKELISSPQRMEEMGNNARKSVEKYGLKNVKEQVMNSYLTVINKTRKGDIR